MRTVSAFSMQHKVSEQYGEKTRGLSQARISHAKINAIGFGIAMGAMYLMNSLLFWYGAQLIEDGEITYLQLMQAIFVLLIGGFGIGNAMSDMGDQRLGVEAAARVFKMIDEGAASPIDGLSTTGARPDGKATGRIVIKDVNFRYPTRPDVRVCKGMNLTIEPGEMVAFVGPSGSGKSTIINLLLRYYDPQSGSLSIDGQDIKDLNVRWLRSQIGYVGQEPVLFQGSVQDNIAKGREGSLDQPVMSLQEAMLISDAKQESVCAHVTSSICGGSGGTHAALPVSDSSAVSTGDIELGNHHDGAHKHVDEDIVETCKASNAHDFIQTFPKAYDTDIGEGSIMVSGGQKQRIAIARALIKKPTILLLDEATSALDATSERVVQESIDALQRMKAQTTIVIAHRLTTIRNAGKIVVIDKGSVVETGKHDELLAKGGLYATLWNKQSGGDQRSTN